VTAQIPPQIGVGKGKTNRRRRCRTASMPTLVKICGIRDFAALNAALDAGADLVGFVFYPRSPRAISPDEAAKLANRARGRASIVALTVDADDELHSRIVERINPDLMQLHGKETVERIAAVRARFGRPIMKAVSVASAEDLKAVAVYAPVVDRLLFDARPPAGKIRPGGRGAVFDWSLIGQAERTKPIMLSGGLNPDNVAEAIRTVRPDGVDVSSGVEALPGAKDPNKIRAFVRAARQAEETLVAQTVASSA
jgi:phosphoribosylanthranilate isomerase